MLAIGSRGILISREVDPTTNQFVWTTALDAHGLSTQVVNALEINASQIKGDILSSYDNSTWINLNNGEFNFKDKIKFVDNKFSITLNSGGTMEDFVAQYEKDKQDMANDINDVSQEVTNIKDNIDVIISDGIITEAEVVSIEKSIMQLQKEKLDIDTRYNSMSNNSYLDSDLKITLISSYNNYTKAHKNFVDFIRNIITDRKITERERADLDTYSSSYNTTLATLKANMDTCLSNIAENNTAYQINNLKTKIDSDFKDVNDRLDAIMDDVGGAVADGIIEEAEVLIIQNSINQLNKEKEDVDMIYNTLYNNDDVPTDIKRNLKTKYDEYIAIHRNLITFINNMISDKVATESEKATFNNLSSSYSTKLAEFKNVANIALVMANKNYTDTQFNVLDGKIEMRVTSQEVKGLINTNLEESKAYSDTLFQECQNQIDGVVETYYQSTDPSLDWTTDELKAKHIGDIWYDTLNRSTYIYGETYVSTDGTVGTAWQKLTDAEAEQAYALASSKAKVFTSTPTTPYKKGDLWVQGSGGDIMRCIYTRTSGNYSSSDWAKASKYTDDTKANQVATDLTNNYYTIEQTNSAIEIAKESIELGVTKEVEVIYNDIGGRNLIRNSAFVNGTICWYFSQNVTLDTSRTFNGHPTVKNSQSGATSLRWWGCTNGHLPIYNKPLDSNQTYTLSCYYYVEDASTFDHALGLEVKGEKVGYDGDNVIGGVYVYSSDMVTNKWTRISVTFTPTEEYSYSYVYAYVAKNGTAWFADFKLEKGSRYTAWSAAPEDFEDFAEAKIKISSNSITNSVSENYVTKDAFNNTTSNLATKSELTQTSNSITAKFTSAGGQNLLRNGRPRTSLRKWDMTWGEGNSGNKRLSTGGNNWKNEYFYSGIWWWGSFPTSNWCCLVNNSLSSYKFNTSKTYSVSAIIYNSKGTKQVTIRICDGNGINIVTQQTFSITNGYQYVNFEFTPQQGGNIPWLMFYLETTGDYEFYIPWVVVKEGTVTKTWIPNGDEIEEGITTIDKSGITVSHSDVNTTTKMTASGFYIEDGNGETIASLSSKKQWTELKADKVFAKNIENVYQGNLNLYVDHSNTRVGDGTSSNPFSDFASLVDYLEATPVIKKSITINVVSSGNVSDNLYLQNLSGGAEIRFRVNRNLILNGNGANSAFYFYNCDNHIIVNGGRASYDTSDGALINKFKYGVFFNRCKYGVVEYIAIDTSGTGNEQWGVLFRETNGETRRIDFINSPNAVFADMGSNVCDNDSCGNCTNAFFSQNGSNIIFGSNVDSGYRPNGAFKKNKGNVVDLGNRTAKASFRNPPAKPATSNQYKDFSFSDYGYYSEGYGNWNSIGYKTIYQGNWGYGNNRGIFTLPNSSISSFLSGGTVLDGNQITLQRENAGGYSASQTIYLWGTTQTSASGSAPPLTKSYGSIGSLAWGEKKTFALPKAFVQDLKSGTIKSVMFYTSDGSNYVKFSAVCTLRLKVNK